MARGPQRSSAAPVAAGCMLLLFLALNVRWNGSSLLDHRTGTKAVRGTCFNVTGTPELREAQCQSQSEFLSEADWFVRWRRTTLPASRYFPDANVVFCQIPNSARRQYKQLLLRSAGNVNWKSTIKKVDQKFARFSIFENNPNAAMMLLTPKVTKFVIVRNPMMRVLAAFRAKFKVWQLGTNISPVSFRLWAKTEFSSPNDDLPQVSNCSMRAFWRPQICWCGLAQAPLLFTILKEENASAQIEFVSQVFASDLLDDRWGDSNTSFGDSLMREEDDLNVFLHYYDLETFDTVADKLSSDIYTLDYGKEIVAMRGHLVQKQSSADPVILEKKSGARMS